MYRKSYLLWSPVTVKIAKYLVFCVHRRSCLQWPPVIVPARAGNEIALVREKNSKRSMVEISEGEKKKKLGEENQPISVTGGTKKYFSNHGGASSNTDLKSAC